MKFDWKALVKVALSAVGFKILSDVQKEQK